MKKKIFTLLALFAGVLSASADDQVTVKSVEMVPNGESKVNIELASAVAYKGYSFSLTLPDGITPVAPTTDEEKALQTLPTETAGVTTTAAVKVAFTNRQAADNFYVFSKVTGQKIDFVVLPKDNTAHSIAAGAGVIMGVYVKAPDKAVEGAICDNAAGKVEKVVFTDGTADKDMAAIDPLAFNTYRSGDINGDGKRNGSDYDLIADIILEKKSADDYVGRAGDLNGDGKINGSDYDFVADIILEKKSINAPELAQPENEIEPE